MEKDTVQAEVPLEKLTRVYIKMRDKKAELTQQLEAEIVKVENGMKAVKTAILDHMKAIGAESLRTEAGVVYRTVRTVYSTNDWESMNKFILEHGVPDLLEKRLHQTNMKAFLEENPDVLPPGLNANSEYSVTIKRSKNG
jgi:hemerythrin-like domain-containing protein